jgi:hypothetical protein
VEKRLDRLIADMASLREDMAARTAEILAALKTSKSWWLTTS